MSKVKTPKAKNSVGVEELVRELDENSGLKPAKGSKAKVKTPKSVANATAAAIKKQKKKVKLARSAKVKTGGAGKGSKVHITDRYGKQGDYATKAMDKRYALQEAIAAGGCTIGDIIDDFGLGRNGMRRVARYVRKGFWVIKGVAAVPNAKNDFDAEKVLAVQLAKMSRTLGIKAVKMPTELLQR